MRDELKRHISNGEVNLRICLHRGKIKHMGPLGLAFLTSMLTTALNTNIIPHIWKLANIVPIPKPNKDIDKSLSYMLICLLSNCKDTGEEPSLSPNNTAYKRWSCHSGHKLLCKLCRTFTGMGARFTVTSSIPYTSNGINLTPSYSLSRHTCNTNNSTHITVTVTTSST